MIKGIIQFLGLPHCQNLTLAKRNGEKMLEESKGSGLTVCKMITLYILQYRLMIGIRCKVVVLDRY